MFDLCQAVANISDQSVLEQWLMGMSRFQALLLAGFSVLTVLSCIQPPFPQQIVLQHIPTCLAVFLLVVSSGRYPLSNAAFVCIILFLGLHVLGARYIYSYVPYEQWLENLFDVRLADKFGWRRNHYDRLVHFAFGALAVLPVWEVCTRYCGVPRRFAYYTAFEFVLAFSMLYELVEWGLAVILAPESAAAYNGQQGDMWDAQKDMLCALIGALFGLAVIWLKERRVQASERLL